MGLPTTTCPECGFDLTRMPFLRWADRGWLRTIVLGGTLIRIGAMGAVVSRLFGADVLTWVVSHGIPMPLHPKVLAHTIAVGFLVVAAVGAWMLATPDPLLIGDEARERRRTLYRSAVAILLGVAALRAGVGHLMPPVAATSLTFVGVGFTIYVLRGLTDITSQLLSRCETATPDERASSASGGRLIGWILIGVPITLAFWFFQRGLTRFAQAAEATALLFGTVVVAFVLLARMKSARPVREELAKARRASQ